MPSNYAQIMSKRVTPQTEQAHPAQVRNSAGGFSFKVDCWKQVERFLILGAAEPTYYIDQRKLVKENVSSLDTCVAEDATRLINLIVEISEAGRAPKNEPAIFALAYLSGHHDKEVRKAAMQAMLRVCRTGSHLHRFISDARQFRGWGRLMRKYISEWYTSKDARALAYQITKYKHRDSESHVDTLRRSHTMPADTDQREVIAYAARSLCNTDDGAPPVQIRPEHAKRWRQKVYHPVQAGPGFSNWLTDDKPHRQLIAAVEHARRATSAQEIVRLIRAHDLVRECIPTQFLNSVEVWDALLESMPMAAMLRNLGKMSAVGLLAPLSAHSKIVCERLHNKELLRKARIHPMDILVALTTYKAGHGVKGGLTWDVVPQIGDALDDAFYMAFDNVEPTGKNFLLGCDVSASMSARIAGTHLSMCVAAGAMAMTAMRTEPNTYIHGFCGEFVDLTKPTPDVYSRYNHGGVPGMLDGISAKSKLSDVARVMQQRNFGTTDCSLPMQYALRKRLEVDVFCVYTDSETYVGVVHPHQALEEYRQKMGRNAKLVVCGMCANQFTIANPQDPGMLDVVGFDTTVPRVIADFARQG